MIERSGNAYSTLAKLNADGSNAGEKLAASIAGIDCPTVKTTTGFDLTV